MRNTFTGRILAERAGEMLGFNKDEISILTSQKKLQPLGNPGQNSPKYFAACEIEEFARDREWLDDATRTITNYWKKKNKARTSSKINGRAVLDRA